MLSVFLLTTSTGRHHHLCFYCRRCCCDRMLSSCHRQMLPPCYPRHCCRAAHLAAQLPCFLPPPRCHQPPQLPRRASANTGAATKLTILPPLQAHFCCRCPCRAASAAASAAVAFVRASANAAVLPPTLWLQWRIKGIAPVPPPPLCHHCYW